MNTQIFITLVEYTPSWSISNAIIMLVCNLLCIGLGRYAIQVRGLGPSIPVLGLKGLGLPELLATTSLGHIIGAGTIIGLNSVGTLH
uniref:Photosystem I reaction center subunit PsaK n=2 Tax=Gracilariopsis TaxID=2781 RepID=A0A1C9CEV2_9FLOR|nr:photosystem I reaction center subunit X [Gracilariopsis lemaneiformis]YP_009294678.1 photosystem I subunit X [Gracilariopsis chorda]AJO68508.1 photosystem I subunit X [Gracilariopsis lemaneiformis]AML79852.1 photosystem I reaction center subunit X [Gracilariopsis lemaneiformis]AOM66938.1 photosystem I subunit X [Gracilariopsis chorda]